MINIPRGRERRHLDKRSAHTAGGMMARATKGAQNKFTRWKEKLGVVVVVCFCGGLAL